MAEVREALSFVRAERCICRIRTVRHQTLLALLEFLSRRKSVRWDDVLARAATNARALNDHLGLPLTARPASGVYLSGPLDVKWFVGFVGRSGNKRDGRRYAKDGPVVTIEITDGRDGVRVGLGRDGRTEKTAPKAPPTRVLVGLPSALLARAETILGRPGEKRSALLTRVLDEAVRAAETSKSDAE